MKRQVFLLLCLISALPNAGCTSMADEVGPRTAYPYCNVYAASACFGVAQGDVVTMRLPADFATYDVTLAGGTKVQIYSGYNPPRVEGGSQATKYFTPSGAYEHALTQERKHVITYTPQDSSSPLLQIVVNNQDFSEDRFAQFLGSFHPCKSGGAGVVCQNEQSLFVGGIMVTGSLPDRP